MTKNKDRSDEVQSTNTPYWEIGLENDRLAHLIRQLSRSFRRSLEFRLSENSISFGHWIFLRILWREDGLSQKELSAQAGLMEPTTHTAMNKMESLGFVERRHLSGNRKRIHIFLSERGRQLEAVLTPYAEAVNHKAVAGIAPADLEIVRNCLLTMMNNLTEDERLAVDSGQRIKSTRSQKEQS